MSHFTSGTRTKKLMSESLRKLIATRPLNKISIQQITNDCGLNRQTFYYHFQDIYSLLEWMCQEGANAFFKEHKEMTARSSLTEFLNYFKENETVCASVINLLGDDHFRSIFYTGIYEALHLSVKEFSAGLQIPDKFKNFIVHFYAVSFVAYLVDWLKAGLKPDVEELTSMLEVILQRNMQNALEIFSSK